LHQGALLAELLHVLPIDSAFHVARKRRLLHSGGVFVAKRFSSSGCPISHHPHGYRRCVS
jgi:hypothetical protein